MTRRAIIEHLDAFAVVTLFVGGAAYRVVRGAASVLWASAVEEARG